MRHLNNFLITGMSALYADVLRLVTFVNRVNTVFVKVVGLKPSGRDVTFVGELVPRWSAYIWANMTG